MSLLIITLFLPTIQQPIEFDFDWAAFLCPSDSIRVEFYYGIPYHQLDFALMEDYLTAHFTVEFAIRGLNNSFSESGTLRKRARMRSFQEAFATQRRFVDQFSVLAPPGVYEIRATIAESLRSGTVIDTITVPAFTERPCLSSILLGTTLLTDTTTGRFAVVPNPGHRYFTAPRRQSPGGEVKRVYAYFEGYAGAAGTNFYELRYFLLSLPHKDTIFASLPIKRRATNKNLTTTLELNIDSVQPGSYIFAVQLFDPITHQTAMREAYLTIASEETPVVRPYQFQFSPTEARYARQLEYVATPRELDYYNSLSDEGKDAYLAWFWSKHNLKEFARRMEVAETRFKTARTPGVKTDRGRIYVRYGEPDAIERKTIEMEIKPREYWFYYQLGLTFVFIDLRGDGNFRLAWTNSPDESTTGLENLLTPEEQERFH